MKWKFQRVSMISCSLFCRCYSHPITSPILMARRLVVSKSPTATKGPISGNTMREEDDLGKLEGQKKYQNLGIHECIPPENQHISCKLMVGRWNFLLKWSLFKKQSFIFRGVTDCCVQIWNFWLSSWFWCCSGGDASSLSLTCGNFDALQNNQKQNYMSSERKYLNGIFCLNMNSTHTWLGACQYPVTVCK